MTTDLRFSVLTTVYNPEPEHLLSCLASVANQTFSNWEHVIVDDASTRPDVIAVLKAADSSPHIRVIWRSENGGIVAASQDALAAAHGEYVALLDHDDELAPDALAAMSEAIDTQDATGVLPDLLYSDNDLVAPDGRHWSPFLKPDFSPERLRAQNYIVHLSVLRKAAVDAVGGFRDGYDGAQDHDLVLRVTERADSVVHVPRILYHWRQAPTSVSTGDTKPWAFDAGVRAVADHCKRVGIDATVERSQIDGCYRVRRRLTSTPLVSVVIPTRGGVNRVWGEQRCFVVEAVRSIIEKSTYQNLEFVVVYDDTTPDSVVWTLQDLAPERMVLVRYDKAFNFSEKMNLGVAASRGEHVLLLNDDTELIDPDSIEVLVAHLQHDDVGMVGAKLLFADGTVQHGGHVYIAHPVHLLVGWPGDSGGPGPLRPLALERETSGVTAAVAMMRRSVYDELGGFSMDLPLNYNDVDLCLKVTQAGYRIIWTPWSTWYHFESQTREAVVLDSEIAYIEQRWGHVMRPDPYHNPNLSQVQATMLERPRSAETGWYSRLRSVYKKIGGFVRG